jgi:hypothetical protein
MISINGSNIITLSDRRQDIDTSLAEFWRLTRKAEDLERSILSYALAHGVVDAEARSQYLECVRRIKHIMEARSAQ